MAETAIPGKSSDHKEYQQTEPISATLSEPDVNGRLKSRISRTNWYASAVAATSWTAGRWHVTIDLVPTTD
jgi:hypothetical protein